MSGSTGGYRNVATASERFIEHKEVCHSVALIFVIVSQQYTGSGRHGLPRFLGQLLAGFIHTYNRDSWVMWPGIDRKYILHRTHKQSVSLRRYTPLLFAPWFQLVFFNAFLTASWERLSTYPNLTTLSASNRRLQRALPTGGLLQAKAIR